MDGTPFVLVTGSSGLIGTRVVDVLRPDHHVVGMDVRRPAALPPGTDFVACDLGKAEEVLRGLDAVARISGGKLASVIHLAAWYDFTGKPSPLYRDLTVGGTEHLLRGLGRFEVGQFVFSSSLLVMKAVQPGELLDEDSPVEPTWAYPTSKVEAEEVIAAEHGDIPTVVLRIAGVYTDACQSIPIAQQIARVYERKLEGHLFPGRTDSGQAFVHLDDLAHCVRLVVLLRGKLAREELFLVAEPDVMTYDELQDRIGELVHGKEWATLRIPKAVAKAGAWAKEKLAGEETFIKPWMVDLADAHYAVDIRHARSRLGWEPVRRLRDTLEPMVAALRRDPEGWYGRNKIPVPAALARA